MRKICNNIGFIVSFAIDDFKAKYAGSVGGMLWAFIQPLTTILLYWFVFQVVFHSGDVNGVPYILWLVNGLLPWFYVGEVIPSSVGTLHEYSYLIKKVKFNVNVLPIIKPISSLFVHGFLIIIAMLFLVVYGIYPSLAWTQILYYMIYMLFICLGFSYLLSTLYVFFKDISQIVSVLLQVVFWTTPIVWNVDLLNSIPLAEIIIKHMPLFYVVNGYRGALLGTSTIMSYDVIDIIYYWAFAIIILILGKLVFKNCKRHFADVL